MASGAKGEDDEDQYLVDFDDCQSPDKPKSGNLNVNVTEIYHPSDILEDSIDNSQNVLYNSIIDGLSILLITSVLCMYQQINITHPLGDVSLVGESPSRIDQIDYNVVCMRTMRMNRMLHTY